MENNLEPEMDKMLKLALRSADEADIFFSSSQSTKLDSMRDNIDSASYSLGSGCALRIMKGSRMGFSYFTDPKYFDTALATALGAAKHSIKTGMKLPKQAKLPTVNGLFDKKLASATEADFSMQLCSMIDALKKSKAKLIQGSVMRDISESTLINSNGAIANSKDALMSAFASAICGDAAPSKSRISRKMFDAAELSQGAGSLAEMMSKAKKTSGKFTIILEPVLVSELLSQMFTNAVNGYSVFRKQSPFEGKLGTRVAADNLSVYDDPLIQAGINSYPCDDEGVPASKKAIIEDGTLKSFLYNLKAAAMARTNTTGNGLRGSFADGPGVLPSNLVFASEDREPLAELHGIAMRELSALHTANYITGDFALNIECAYEWDKGELGNGIRGCVLIGNFFEILKKLRLADDDGNFSFYYGPSWVFEGKIV